MVDPLPALAGPHLSPQRRQTSAVRGPGRSWTATRALCEPPLRGHPLQGRLVDAAHWNGACAAVELERFAAWWAVPSRSRMGGASFIDTHRRGNGPWTPAVVHGHPPQGPVHGHPLRRIEKVDATARNFSGPWSARKHPLDTPVDRRGTPTAGAPDWILFGAGLVAAALSFTQFRGAPWAWSRLGPGSRGHQGTKYCERRTQGATRSRRKEMLGVGNSVGNSRGSGYPTPDPRQSRRADPSFCAPGRFTDSSRWRLSWFDSFLAFL